METDDDKKKALAKKEAYVKKKGYHQIKKSNSYTCN